MALRATPTLTLPGSTELTEVRSTRGGDKSAAMSACICFGSSGTGEPPVVAKAHGDEAFEGGEAKD